MLASPCVSIAWVIAIARANRGRFHLATWPVSLPRVLLNCCRSSTCPTLFRCRISQSLSPAVRLMSGCTVSLSFHNVFIVRCLPCTTRRTGLGRVKSLALLRKHPTEAPAQSLGECSAEKMERPSLIVQHLTSLSGLPIWRSSIDCSAGFESAVANP